MDKIRIEIAPVWDSDENSENERKERRKKLKDAKKTRDRKKPTIISMFFMAVILASILSIIVMYKVPEIRSKYTFIISFVGFLILEVFLSILPASIGKAIVTKYHLFHKRLFLFATSFFFFVLVPFMLYTPLIIGAVHAQYPYESNFTAKTDGNLTLAGDAVAKGFQQMVIRLYDMGAERPTFWLVLVSIGLIVATILAWRSSKGEVYANMEAKELLETLTKKDYDYEPKKNMLEGLFTRDKRSIPDKIKKDGAS